MAKPIPVPPLPVAGPSTFPHCYSQSHPQPSHRRRHRSHRPSKSSSSSIAGPSSGLLSLLATIASANTVYGSPAPPEFLCPSIDSSEGAVNLPPKRRSWRSPTNPQRKAKTKSRSARYIPDKYQRGDDGVWRRVETYTLYGSTMPSSCSSLDCRQPTHASPSSSVDDQIKVQGTQNTTSTNSTYDFRNELPPGWTTPTNRFERTTLILSLSIVLSLLICFFIIGCLFWRRKAYKKRKNYDIEAKAKRRRHRHDPTEEEVREMEAEKELKAKQKSWARATARWRSNARYSARQRRGKRLSTRLSQAHQSVASLDTSHSRLADTAPSNHSRHSSRNSSTTSLPIDENHGEAQGLESQESLSSQEPRTSPEAPQITAPPSPPAYQHRGQLPQIVISPDEPLTKGVSGRSTPAHVDRSRRPSHSSAMAPSIITTHSQIGEPLPRAPIHAAHVATDDKALLARLAELASAPPADDASESVETSEAEISVPAWQDEEIEDFTHATSLAPKLDASSSSPSSFFPPPPSKERLAAAERLEYSFGFDGLDSAEPEPEPSAPPFEEGSAPPLDNDVFPMPSAPPLLDEQHGLEVPPEDAPQPSAPGWDSLPRSLDSPEEGADEVSVPDMTLGVPGPSTTPASSTSGQEAVFTAAEDRPLSTATVSTLPDYHP